MILHRKSLVGMIGLAVALCASMASAQATDPVPWQLDLEIEKLGSLTVSPRPGHAETVWYVLYTVTNETGEERPFRPHFRIETDTEKTYFETVSPEAARTLEIRLGREVKTSAQMEPTIADGETREAVAFFGTLDPAFDRVQVAVTGIRDVVYRVGLKRFYEKRSLVFEWKRPGDEYYVDRDIVQFVKKYWKTLEGPREIG
jgi:hypothetical protein